LLTAGKHRLEALKSLGWTELTVGEHVIVREENDRDAKLSEIDENLARHDLGALDRALFLAERKKLYAEMRGKTSRGGDRKSLAFKEEKEGPSWAFGFSKSFTEEAEKKLGISRTTAKRSALLAAKLDREAIDYIRGTMVERNQQELLALAELPPARQRAAAKAIREKRAKTVAQARVALGFEDGGPIDAQAALIARFKITWKKADDSTRASIKRLITKSGARE
jgi:ParB family chromosome partitioning protein